MKEKVIDFGNEKVSVLFKKLFFPTVLGMLSMSAVTTIDGIFVGHGVGSDGIAAVNICVPLLMVLMGVGLMIGAGCSVIASIHLSKGKNSLARASITQAMLFVTLISNCGGIDFDYSRKDSLFVGGFRTPIAYGCRLFDLVFPIFIVRTMDSCCLICNAIGWCSKTCYVV